MRGPCVLLGMAATVSGLLSQAPTEWVKRGLSAKVGHAMAYDRDRGRVVLFGGGMYGGVSAETWEWDGTR